MEVHEPQSEMRYYYVDESGDGVLFNRKGKVLIGTPGCQRHFMLGLLDIADPEALQGKFRELRQALLDDPYFRNVPSMQPERRKTAVAFHAKDDPPEVRREVFRVLVEEKARFFAVVKDMRTVLEYVRGRNAMQADYRYRPNELYDLTVRMLFKNRLHLHDRYEVVFAKRGKKDRTQALRENLLLARERFRRGHAVEREIQIAVIPRKSEQSAGLQAVDYYLWALQRLYEKGEGRFIEYLWPNVSLVHDVDDTRQAEYGVYYSKNKPLTKPAVKGRS